LKELDDKVAALEKKHKSLSDENAAMEKSIAQAKGRQRDLRPPDGVDVGQAVRPGDPAQRQAERELEALWYEWMKEDQEKGANPTRWTNARNRSCAPSFLRNRRGSSPGRSARSGNGTS
jgi:hypothetical protein